MKSVFPKLLLAMALVTPTMAFAQSEISLRQTFEGKLFQVTRVNSSNGFSYKYTNLGSDCAVDLGRAQLREQGERIAIEYRLRGFPKVTNDWSSGVAEGNAIDSIYGAQNLVNAGIFGMSEVVTDLVFTEVSKSQFLTQQKLSVEKVNIHYGSSAGDYFGGNGDKWAYECQINK